MSIAIELFATIGIGVTVIGALYGLRALIDWIYDRMHWS